METRKKFTEETFFLATFASKCLADMFIDTFKQKYSNDIMLHIDEDSQGKKQYSVYNLDYADE